MLIDFFLFLCANFFNLFKSSPIHLQHLPENQGKGFKLTLKKDNTLSWIIMLLEDFGAGIQNGAPDGKLVLSLINNETVPEEALDLILRIFSCHLLISLIKRTVSENTIALS